MSKSTCWHYFKKFYCVDKYLNSSYTSHCDPMLAQPSLYQYQHTHTHTFISGPKLLVQDHLHPFSRIYCCDLFASTVLPRV